MRVWSIADGKLLRTIWVPAGPTVWAAVYAVAISPDGSMIAAGGWTESRSARPFRSIYSTAKSGSLIRRIHDDLPDVTEFLTFSPDGRYLAAVLSDGWPSGLRPGQGLARGVPRRPIRR